ncbi:MAG: N-acetyltransferase [Firmicutes bacterium]|jgi:UDP-2-acetamido-3-amino-2,3-dideoxy-glucuronate N-acetyltransferase|nr:N-acetyltransferase [Bacillota bacterium]
MSFFIHETSWVDDNVIIGDGTKIWYFCHIQSDVIIGKQCSFGQNVNIANNVKIGNGCKIQNNVSIYEGVELEDNVFCGPSMVFTNDLMPRATVPRSDYDKTFVRMGASIGANATIVCGYEIGRWAMIAAGATVTKNVPAYALVAGTPAKQIGWVCECGQRLDKDLKCSCGRMYRKTGMGLEEIR